MQIYELTVPELDYYKSNCNFLDDELQFFILRSRKKSYVQIALTLNVSEAQVSKISKRVKSKMNRVQNCISFVQEMY